VLFNIALVVKTHAVSVARAFRSLMVFSSNLR
jgi:hypothetical protein